MNNISTGFGLCVLGLGIAAWPILDRLAPSANASAVTAAASAVSAAATAQTTPTIVWYGVCPSASNNDYQTVFRAWSDGRVEARKGTIACYSESSYWISPTASCNNWIVVSDAAQGLTFRSDINFDAQVDGADLGQLLADWGNAPRQDIPPSACPLNLVNP